MELLRDIVVLILCSAAVLVLFSRIRVPSILGFILTGTIIGPSGFHLISNTTAIELFAEVGVMLLMFTIGLEFSLSAIRKMRFEALVLGSLQMGLTMMMVAAICLLLGLKVYEAILIAFVVSMSSTAIVMKLLQDQRKLQTPYGKIMVGILLFQDICLVPLMIFTPFLTPLHENHSSDILWNLLKSFVLMAVIFMAVKFLLPRVLDFVLQFRVREVFLPLVLALCFGLSLLTSNLGFSLAMGSFIAGMILAESHYIYEIETEIKSLKNFFLSLFFVSIGMLLDLDYFFDSALQVLAGTGGIIGVKTIIVFLILYFAKYPVNISVVTALGIAQVGEFSFLLLNLAKGLKILSAESYQYLLSVTIVSMLITPFLLYVGSKIVKVEILKEKVKMSGAFPALQDHVVIGGFGINGQHLAKIFKALDIPFSVIEMNPATVKKFKEQGENIMFGDITRADNLARLQIEKAAMFVLAISDPEATLKAIEIGRNMNKNMRIIVRSDFFSQIKDAYQKGADAVVSQDFEAAIQISSQILKYFGISTRFIRIQNELLRKHQYKFFMERENQEPDFKLAEMAAISELCELYLVRRGHPLVGRTVKEIDFTANGRYLNVRIIGVVRKDELLRKVRSDFMLQEHDTLLLFGEQGRMEDAKEYLDNFGK